MKRTMSLRSAKRPSGYAPTFTAPYMPRQFGRQEWKFTDQTTGALEVCTTATLTLLNGLAPGNSASQRIGSKVSWMSMEAYIQIFAHATTGIDNKCRLLVVLDKQPNGAAPGAITDILQTADFLSPRNLANRKRFKIMWDKRLYVGNVLNAAGTGTAIPNFRLFKIYKKFKYPLQTDFNAGVAGTVADIATNSLYFCTLGNTATGATTATCSGYFRLRYTDS